MNNSPALLAALLRAARRAPTPAAAASVHAALLVHQQPERSVVQAERRRRTPTGDFPDNETSGWEELAGALAETCEPALAALDAPGRPDPHERGEPDPAFDWMFAPRPYAVSAAPATAGGGA